MLSPVDVLEYDDQEVFYQVLVAALPLLTVMQRECLLLSLIGLTQTQIGQILTVSQQSVSQHMAKALSIISATAGEYV